MQNEELIVANIKYAFGIANRVRHTFYDYELDDADSEALLALVIAGERFDPDKSPSFNAWIRTRIVGALMDWSVSLKARYGMSAQAGRGPKLSRKNPFCEVDIKNGGVVWLRGREEYRLLGEALAVLPVRLFGIIRRYYVDGETQPQIARALGVTPCRVTQLMNRAHELLRKELALRGVRKVADIL